MDLQSKEYLCSYCGKTFHSKLSNFNQHLKKFHGIVHEKTRNMKCLETNCELSFTKLMDLRNHLQDFHQLPQVLEELEFNTLQAFHIWKENEELRSQYYWTKQYGSSSDTNSAIISVFYCNRSGNKRVVDIVKRKRVGKSQGSCKTESVCTSSIVVTATLNKVNVKFYKTHYGHSVDIAHIPLPTNVKRTIAAQLILGIPSTEILDKIRENVEDGFRRIHLTTMKDINNISNSFNVNHKIMKHHNDAISIKLWVNEMQAFNDNCILMYKEQHVDNALDGLNKEDFLLAIMTMAQKNLLKKFGQNNIICMDATHGTNPYDFKLITVMTIDDFGEGFPVAFLISNREDYVTLKYFISAIKEKAGDISASVFMSDDADQYFSAWSSVMDVTFTKKLLCTWHVDKAWRNKISLIKNKFKQQEMYKMLCTVRQEPDVSKFNNLLDALCILLNSDKECIEFGNYFKKFYANRSTTWAASHRQGCGINTNMHLEAMHKVLKYIYLKGTVCKRLDKTVYLLQKFVRDKQFERVIKLTKGKSNRKLAQSNNRHFSALNDNMKFTVVNENKWMFMSDKSQYTVSKYCIPEHNCMFQCSLCNACIHVFKCTCMDFVIKGNICKHMHTICIQLKNKNNQIPSDCADTSELSCNDEIDMHLESLKTPQVIDIDQIKKKIICTLRNVSSAVQVSQDLEFLKEINSRATSLKNFASSGICVNQLSANMMPTVNSPVPSNKKIDKQLLFSSTKKKRKVSSGLSKPTLEEQDEIEEKLLVCKSIEN